MNELVIYDIKAIEDLSAKLDGCAILPNAYKRQQERLYALLRGRELGLPPIYALDNIQVINGRATLSADCKLAICKKSPEYAGSELTYSDNDIKATFKLSRKMANGTVDTVIETFTLDDAKRAGLMQKDNWMKHPKRMLRARVIGFACNDLFGDLLAGTYTPDEVEEMDSKPIPANYEVSDVPKPKPNSDIDKLRDAANNLLGSVSLTGSQAEEYRQSIKDFHRDGLAEQMKAVISALASIKKHQEDAKRNQQNANKPPAVETIEDAVVVPEPPVDVPAQHDPDPQHDVDPEIIALWDRIQKAYKQVKRYKNATTQANSIKKHFGVDKLNECFDKQKLTAYLDRLSLIYHVEKDNIASFDKMVTLCVELISSLSVDADTVAEYEKRLTEANNSKDSAKLIDLYCELS